MPEFAADPKALAFLAHWQQLRRDGALPSLRDFLDHPSVNHAAEIFIFDVLEDVLRVRLQGTRLVERWGKDYTGQGLYAQRTAQFRASSLGNYKTMLTHPCGCYMIDQLATNHGRLSAAHITQLPLTDKNGRPSFVAAYSQEVAARRLDEVLVAKSWTHSARWVDVGADVPTATPNLPSEADPPQPPYHSTLAGDIARRRD